MGPSSLDSKLQNLHFSSTTKSSLLRKCSAQQVGDRERAALIEAGSIPAKQAKPEEYI